LTSIASDLLVLTLERGPEVATAEVAREYGVEQAGMST
jgi:hypothetical protein